MGEQWKLWQIFFFFFFFGSNFTAVGDYSYEIKKTLTFWKEIMTNLDSILKSRDITLPTKVRPVKAMVFPVVIYECEGWNIKKAECQRMMLLNCDVGEDSWESLRLQGDPTSQSWRKSVLNIHWKDWWWNWNSNTLATWREELMLLSCGVGEDSWESLGLQGDPASPS